MKSIVFITLISLFTLTSVFAECINKNVEETIQHAFNHARYEIDEPDYAVRLRYEGINICKEEVLLTLKPLMEDTIDSLCMEAPVIHSPGTRSVCVAQTVQLFIDQSKGI